jgi:hypothetical protein
MQTSVIFAESNAESATAEDATEARGSTAEDATEARGSTAEDATEAGGLMVVRAADRLAATHEIEEHAIGLWRVSLCVSSCFFLLCYASI